MVVIKLRVLYRRLQGGTKDCLSISFQFSLLKRFRPGSKTIHSLKNYELFLTHYFPTLTGNYNEIKPVGQAFDIEIHRINRC